MYFSGWRDDWIFKKIIYFNQISSTQSFALSIFAKKGRTVSLNRAPGCVLSAFSLYSENMKIL